MSKCLPRSGPQVGLCQVPSDGLRDGRLAQATPTILSIQHWPDCRLLELFKIGEHNETIDEIYQSPRPTPDQCSWKTI